MKNANETFELLSKLLSEQSTPDTPSTQLYEKLFSVVRQEVSQQLNKSTYPQKSLLIAKLKKVLDGIEILTQFPEIIGKTVIGIMGAGGEVNKALLEHISLQVEPKVYMEASNVPVIIYNSDTCNTIRAINLIESPLALNVKDFVSANQELYKKKIDIRQFMSVFSVSAKIPYENITYINFPFYSLKSQEYYNSLFSMIDEIILAADHQGKWKYELEFLKNSKKTLPIHIAAAPEELEAVRSSISELLPNYNEDGLNPIEIHVVNEDFDKWLQSRNVIRNNASIAERILAITTKFKVYQIKRIEKLKDLISNMNKDLINIDDEETSISIKKLKGELVDSLDTEKRNFSEFNGVSDKLMELIYEFENCICNASNIYAEQLTDNKTLYHGQYDEHCVGLIMNLIEIGDFNTARFYINRLEVRKYPYYYIFELYMDSKMKREPSLRNLEELKQDNSANNLILKAKVKFAAELKLTIEQAAQYAMAVEEPLEDYENFILGEYYSRIDNNKAKHYYWKALEEGYIEAGNKLIKYQESRNPFELEKLANMLVPEANYLYGLNCLENNKYARGITYLKIAAAFEHIKAIHKLAELEYMNASKRPSNPDERAMNIALQLYEYLLHKNPNDMKAKENLGQMYFWRKEFRKSRELLEHCKSPEALFTCGRMYQYGDGTAQDSAKARDLFRAAASKGHIRAKVEYEKVCGWIASSNTNNSYKKGNDYSNTSTSKRVSSSGGACFLTTATCLALGKEDDCEELIAFKKYRDEHLIYDEDGAALIREYYRIAPSILEEIERQPSPKNVYQKLFDDYIIVGYEYLKKNDYINAKATYIGMVESLCRKYSVGTVFMEEK